MISVRAFALLGFLLATSLTAHAQDALPDAPASVSAFRRMMTIEPVNISVPTVVAVPITESLVERQEFAVFDRTAQKFEPYLFLRKTKETPAVLHIEGVGDELERMIDVNPATFTEYALPEQGQGQARIVLTSATPITSSSLSILLDNFVALPTSIELRTKTDGQEKILLAKSTMQGQTIRFPRTTSDTWIVTITYGQPLRVTELRLSQENIDAQTTQMLRFLAQPEHRYTIYLDPDRGSMIPVGEAGNLSSDEGVIVLPAVSSDKNPAYMIADIDADTIPDLQDNCVREANTDQKDIDGNGRGDVCDDFDRDGLITKNDNCPNQPNRNQLDTDGDGLGDVCDDEESRITEKNPWLPWVGMGFAAVVLIGLIVITLKPKRSPKT